MELGSPSQPGAKSHGIMHRWTATILLLVMLVPAFGPVALAGNPPFGPMHCMRRPLQPTPTAELAMHCHHGASQSAMSKNAGVQYPAVSTPDYSESSFRALDCCCCHDCDCCRSPKTSEWARPAPVELSFASLQIEPVLAAPAASFVSSAVSGPDSARGPPRS